MNPRILFYGTPDFAVASLKALIEHGFNVIGVVTAPDKPAGRGKHLSESAVKQFATQHHLPVYQPENLKSPLFHDQLRVLSPDLQVVVAFRMLPREVWQLPNLGTFNLHASLLPHYRGAAPINWAIIHGETETGVTTFLIDEKIDTGRILFSKSTRIGESETAGELHDRLMEMGATLVVETVLALKEGAYSPVDQCVSDLDESNVKKAPKINKEDCLIDWNWGAIPIFNFVRGLSPYPCAYASIVDKNQTPHLLKIYTCRAEKDSINSVGGLVTDGKSFLKVSTKDGSVSLLEVQVPGRKVMKIAEFLNGFGRLFH